MRKKPYADSALAKYLEKRILELRPKTQAEIAAEAGFVNPNMLTMIKQGASKLALDRVPSLAKALECDPTYLLRLAFEQAVGSPAAKAIFEIMGPIVSSNEAMWIEALRDASDGTDPRLTTRARSALRAIFGK